MMLKKNVLIITMLVILVSTSCNRLSKQEVKTGDISNFKTEEEKNPLIGSWVEPNPINEKEEQGFTINSDGTAESINMATLIYKKWWKEEGKLVLVAESIGNGSSSLDTTKYEIVELDDKELELKDKDYTIIYKKR